MLKENQIFIHIPKTGGTTLNFLLFNKKTAINPDFNYRHIVYETKMSNSGVLFNPLKNDRFISNQIFMMLRHPVDRIISEYYFLRERSEFFSLLKPVPKSFKEYVNHRQTFNYNISFLLGKKIYCKEAMTLEDYQLVINSIEKLDIKIGIFEQFDKSLSYFENELSLNFPKTIENKRVTIKRPRAEEIGEELVNKIIENNKYDFMLYNYALERFQNYKFKENNKFKFIGTRYDYALIYTKKHSLFEITIKNKSFLKINNKFFNELTPYLHSLKLQDPKEFFKLYVNTTLNAVENKFTKLNYQDLRNQMLSSNPLDQLEKVSRFIDNHKVISTKGLEFNANLVPKLKSKSFFSKLFNKKI
ncbi:MAG: hypothetical protein ACI8ZX_001134 [Planctomycetota bacterium]|jgi:hypothetical protein